jgi:hypothetical protein
VAVAGGGRHGRIGGREEWDGDVGFGGEECWRRVYEWVGVLMTWVDARAYVCVCLPLREERVAQLGF